MADQSVHEYSVEASEVTEGSFIGADINIGTVGTPVFQTQKVSKATLFGDSNRPIEENYADVVTLKAAGNLEKGSVYALADKDISIYASSGDDFCHQACRTMRIVKNTYYTSSGVNLGVWKSTLTPSANDIVVWGGKCWSNNAGAVGSATNDSTLSSDWTEIATTNDTYYFTKDFIVIYDFDSDTVRQQSDDRGNIVRGNIDITDWGNNLIYNNYCRLGIYNNSNGDQIYDNILPGGIYANSNVGQIAKNTNNGGIYDNTNTNVITNNRNNGDINGNSNTSSIFDNQNIGGVYGNSNGGAISSNMNLGAIFNNSNTGNINLNSNTGAISTIGAANANIQNNINNGAIFTTTTGDISDTIVNK